MIPEIRTVTVQVKTPKGEDPGQVTTGYYTLADDTLTMTDPSGRPIRRTASSLRKFTPPRNQALFSDQAHGHN
jgi:hypothetical protein